MKFKTSRQENASLYSPAVRGRKKHARHSGSHRPASIMEQMEPRLLLSMAPVATPDFVLFRPVGSASSAHPMGSTAPVGLTPSLVRHAYGIDQTMFGSVVGDGSGQTIAIVDAYNDPNVVADLHAFDVQFGLPDPPSFVRVSQTGTSTLPGTDPAGPGDSWAMEIALDVEWAHAVAPKANLLLVETNSATDSNLFAAINTARSYAGVSVVSMSWGGTEGSSDASTYDRYFTTPSGHAGVTFVASSGDAGAYASGGTTRSVSYPAASANVLAVGGTRLSVNSSGTYVSESGWGSSTSSGANGGSGGGISRYVTQPSYQRGVVTQSTTYRAVPDVAFLADPASGVAVYDSWDSPSSPWVQLGGTSLAAPMWAGVIAMANQGRVLNGLANLNGATETLPKIYALPSSDFHDVTTGNNGYAAGTGYDLVTGRGTPIVNLLAVALAGGTVTPSQPVPTIGSLSTSQASVPIGTSSVTLSANSVQEVSGTISRVVFYRESNGASGLQTTGDVLLGNGTLSNGSWTLSTSTSALAAGSYTYYAIAYDSASVASNVASTTLTVLPAAPTNDSFTGGTVLTGTAIATTSTNVTATREAGEPRLANNIGGRSVWFTWTAPSSGKVSINTLGSTFDTMLGVFTGPSVAALTLIGSNDDASRSTLTSALTFNAVAGTTYHIAVDGYNGASGSIALNLSETVAPINDSFSKSTVLTGRGITWNGTNIGATRELGEPYHAGVPGSTSVWFTWTAPSSGSFSLNTAGSNFDTVLAVYTGTSVSTLTPVASNDDVSPYNLTSALTFNAVAGTTYRIAVDGYNGLAGNVVLNLV